VKVKAEGTQQPSFRVIADHLRSSAFLWPRRYAGQRRPRLCFCAAFMRRAMRHAHLLGARAFDVPLGAGIGEDDGRGLSELGRAQA